MSEGLVFEEFPIGVVKIEDKLRKFLRSGKGSRDGPLCEWRHPPRPGFPVLLRTLFVIELCAAFDRARGTAAP